MGLFGILLTIFIVVFLIILLRYFFYSTNTLTSLQDAKTASTIPASSLPTNQTGSAASNFTYSAWIYINSWNYRYGEPKVVLGRMGAKSSSTSNSGIDGINGADPCPVLALGAVENTITCALSCFQNLQGLETNPNEKTIVHTCTVANVPIQRWVNIAVSVYNQTMDMYMNGKLVRTCILPGPAYIDSTADILVTPKGGFEGYTSNIEYWPDPKNPQEVWNIYVKGYRGNSWSNIFNSYSLQISVTENGTTQGSVSI